MALKRINLNLEESLLEQLDEYAEAMHVNRSAALAVILSQHFMERKAVDTMGNLLELVKSGKLPVSATADKQ